MEVVPPHQGNGRRKVVSYGGVDAIDDIALLNSRHLGQTETKAFNLSWTTRRPHGCNQTNTHDSIAHREKQSHDVPGDAVDSVAVRVPWHDEGFQGRRGHEVPKGGRE